MLRDTFSGSLAFPQNGGITPTDGEKQGRDEGGKEGKKGGREYPIKTNTKEFGDTTTTSILRWLLGFQFRVSLEPRGEGREP